MPSAATLGSSLDGHFLPGYDDATFARAQELLKARSAAYMALIERVTVSSDYTLDIKFNVSYAQFMGKTPEKELAYFG